MKGLLRILPVIALVAVALPGIEKKGSFDITSVVDVQEVWKKGSFDITRKGSFDITEFIVSGAIHNFVVPDDLVLNGRDSEIPVIMG